MSIVVVGVDPAQLVHAVGVVPLEVAVGLVHRALGALETVRAPVVAHHEGVGIVRVVEAVWVGLLALTYRGRWRVYYI